MKIHSVLLGTFALALAGTAHAELARVSAANLQKTLTAQGAAWRAEENWVTRLPSDQLGRMMGLRNPPNVDAQFAAPEVPAAVSGLPASLDWRNKDGINWVSPILNQGNCGSCVAFASVGVLETQVNITAGIPGFNPTFSTQALFACGGGRCEGGWWPDSAVDYLTHTGVPDEACAPYTMGSTGEDVACSSICGDSSSRSLKLVDSGRATDGSRDITAVKKALQHGPVVTTMVVYGDFIAYASGIYKHVTGGYLGGHAVSIVGYNDAQRYWVIRNSWGNEWGEGGFARISYDDTSGISSETWSFQVPQPEGYLSVRNPHGRKFVSGSVALEAESTFPQTTSVQLSVVSPTRSFDLPACDRAPCTQALNTAELPNGHYEVVAKAVWGGGKTAISEHEQFYVYNGTPSLSLSYTLKDNVDLSKPLKGRLVFNLKPATGDEAVPMSQLTLHLADSAGKEVLTKTNYLVVPEMTLGWRTNAIKDGKYDLWFTGRLQTGTVNAEVATPRVSVTTKNGV